MILVLFLNIINTNPQGGLLFLIQVWVLFMVTTILAFMSQMTSDTEGYLAGYFVRTS